MFFSLRLLAETTADSFPAPVQWTIIGALLAFLFDIFRRVLSRNNHLEDKLTESVVPALTESVLMFKEVLQALKGLGDAEKMRAERDEWRSKAERAEAQLDEVRRRT